MPNSFPLKRRSRWPLFAIPAVVCVLAAGWSAFWFYASSEIGEKLDALRVREAKSGRIYECANRTVGGFPFRMEVRCDNPVVTLTGQTAEQLTTQTKLSARLKGILVLTQIYDPTKIIAEFDGPAMVGVGSETPSFAADWTVGRASVAGLPIGPQRVSMAFNNPAIDKIDNGLQSSLFRANHVEVHTRLLEGSITDNPVVETALQFAGGSVQGVHPILTEPFDADIRAQLRGLTNFAPKPWPERFREIQANGGRLDFTQSRLQQGDTIAVAAGALEITPAGYLSGEIKMTVAGIERVVPLLGLDKILTDGVPQATVDRVAPGVKADDVNKVIGALDRLIPGLGSAARKNAGIGVMIGVNLLGQPATLEGKKALAMPLRFVDGAVFIGPLKVAQTPPLF